MAFALPDWGLAHYVPGPKPTHIFFDLSCIKLLCFITFKQLQKINKQINKIRNERELITDATEIQRIKDTTTNN